MSQRPTDRPEDLSRSSRQRGGAPGRPRPIPHYQLILPAAAVTDMMLVIRTIMDLTHLGRAEATHRMWQAYYGGHARILTTYRERAELYAEQFAERGVPVTIEPA